MSNAKPSKKGGKADAPDPPALDASANAANPELARTFANAWTVDLSRASGETTMKRAQALGAVLKPENVGSVVDALVAYVPLLNEADAIMTRESKTPKERDQRKPWQSRLCGVGIVSNALRLASRTRASR